MPLHLKAHHKPPVTKEQKRYLIYCPKRVRLKKKKKKWQQNLNFWGFLETLILSVLTTAQPLVSPQHLQKSRTSSFTLFSFRLCCLFKATLSLNHHRTLTWLWTPRPSSHFKSSNKSVSFLGSHWGFPINDHQSIQLHLTASYQLETVSHMSHYDYTNISDLWSVNVFQMTSKEKSESVLVMLFGFLKICGFGTVENCVYLTIFSSTNTWIQQNWRMNR